MPVVNIAGAIGAKSQESPADHPPNIEFLSTEFIQGKYIFSLYNAKTSSGDAVRLRLAVRLRDDYDAEANDCSLGCTGGCCSNNIQKMLGSLPYIMFIVDLIDVVFDFIMVRQLAQYSATIRHARWLGVCTAVTLLFEIVVKPFVALNMRRLIRGYRNGAPSWEKGPGAIEVLDVGMAIELMIFLVEDASTLFIWWLTGTYNSEDPFAKANLIITIASAGIAMASNVYGFVRQYRANGNSKAAKAGRAHERCEEAVDTLEQEQGYWPHIYYNVNHSDTELDRDNRDKIPIEKVKELVQEYFSGENMERRPVRAIVYAGFTAIVVVPIIFWASLAIAVILKGDYFDCIGACSENATRVASVSDLGSGSGSGEAQGQAGSGFKKVMSGMYALGFVAVYANFYFMRGPIANGYYIMRGKDHKIKEQYYGGKRESSNPKKNVRGVNGGKSTGGDDNYGDGEFGLGFDDDQFDGDEFGC